MYYDNLTLLTDFYELTMMKGYFDYGSKQRAVFDLFFRESPSHNGYAIMAGLEQAIQYVSGLRFSDRDIDYLRSLKCFSEDFLAFLKDFKFSGDIYAIPEGTVIFPGEPLIRVNGTQLEGQLMESALLNIINHQCLIATKAARVVYAAQGDDVLEFGLRRAQGPDAGIYGARAAVIGGCEGTSNVLAGQMFAIPVKGTHAHSWIMSFPDELTAFYQYAESFPNTCILLCDTYDTLRSGVPNAIKVFKDLIAKGKKPAVYGIRLDSGDLSYLSKAARAMFDAAGLHEAIISASSDLDEYLIQGMKLEGAKVSLWGVGTNLITSKDCPAFGGVYKLVALEDADGVYQPKIKLSENPIKITNPGIKKIYRIYDKETNKMKADLIGLLDDELDPLKTLTIFHPNATWKKMTLIGGTYNVRELLLPIFIGGKCVYTSPSVMEIRENCIRELDTLWDEHKRLQNPHVMPVDLSQRLYDLKNSMIAEIRGDR